MRRRSTSSWRKMSSSSYKDLDTGMIMETGWPFFNGGITALLDEEGISGKYLGKKIQP